MILETSVALVLNPEDMGFYIGPYVHKAARPDEMSAAVFIVKLWFVLVQFTMYKPFSK